jgi:hypothetical protein
MVSTIGILVLPSRLLLATLTLIVLAARLTASVNIPNAEAWWL